MSLTEVDPIIYGKQNPKKRIIQNIAPSAGHKNIEIITDSESDDETLEAISLFSDINEEEKRAEEARFKNLEEKGYQPPDSSANSNVKELTTKNLQIFQHKLK